MPSEHNTTSIDKLPDKRPGDTRVLLFSDIHLGAPFESAGQIFSKRILGALNYHLKRKGKIRPERISRLAELMPRIAPDVTICAGDLTCISLPGEFARAEKELAPIMEQSGKDFLYVPGNHDAYVKREDGRKALNETFNRLNGGRFSLESLPQAVEYPGLRLILLNPARPTSWLLSCGYLEQGYAEEMNRLLETDDGTACAAVSHFPAVDVHGDKLGYRHGLKGAQPLINALQTDKAAAVLSGHIHGAYSCNLPGGGTQLCCGSLTLHGTFTVADFSEGRLKRHFTFKIQ